MPLSTAKSPTGKTSGRCAVNIRYMSTVHSPMPLTAMRRLLHPSRDPELAGASDVRSVCVVTGTHSSACRYIHTRGMVIFASFPLLVEDAGVSQSAGANYYTDKVQGPLYKPLYCEKNKHAKEPFEAPRVRTPSIHSEDELLQRVSL
jgi:hypothetical protein